jgi:hypothetical protein
MIHSALSSQVVFDSYCESYNQAYQSLFFLGQFLAGYSGLQIVRIAWWKGGYDPYQLI